MFNIDHPLVSVGMSALWTLNVETSHHSLNVSRGLEVRRTPRIFSIPTANFASPSNADPIRTSVLGSIYDDSVQSWLYSATIELSQSGGTPPWSRDKWSFAPLDLSEIRTWAASLGISASNLAGRSSNITFRTPAVRASLECRTLDTWTDTSIWTEALDFTNKSSWNATNRPPGLDHGYVLKGFANVGTATGFFTCCANETNGVPGESAIGYWSDVQVETLTFKQSIVAKWIVGYPLDGGYLSTDYTVDPGHTYHPLFVWSEQPRLAAINCTPVIEHANANVSVDVETGVVQEYTILGPPQIATEAWLDSYLRRNVSVDYSDGYTILGRGYGNSSTYRNITVR